MKKECSIYIYIYINIFSRTGFNRTVSGGEHVPDDVAFLYYLSLSRDALFAFAGGGADPLRLTDLT